jgi:hypothetical protein
MLDKLSKFFTAAKMDFERTFVHAEAQFDRLTSMREKTDKASKAQPLDLHQIRHHDRSVRRGFDRWFVHQSGKNVQAANHYEDVLSKLTHSASAGSLLDYEKNWAEYSLRNTAQPWTFAGSDTTHTGSLQKSLLEKRLGLITQTKGTVSDTTVVTPESHRLIDHDLEMASLHKVQELESASSKECSEQNAEYNEEDQEWYSDFVAAMSMDGASEEDFTERDLIAPDILLSVIAGSMPDVQVEQCNASTALHIATDNDAANAYSNHSVHWIFEFSEPVEKPDIDRCRHRIKRAV